MTKTTNDSIEATEREKLVTKAQSIYSLSLKAIMAKIVILGLVDALLIAAALAALAANSWLVFSAVIAILIIINAIYLPPNRALPGKYLTPGVIFMLIFSVSVMFYTVYIAFTNYGDRHVLPKDDAIVAILKNSQARVEGSPSYPSAIAEKSGDLWLIVIDPSNEKARAGNNRTPLKEISGVEKTSLGAIKSAAGYRLLEFAEISKRSAEISKLNVAISDDPNDGFLLTTTGSEAYLYKSTMTYDKGANTMTNAEGKVFHDNGRGSFVADDGTRIDPGWRVMVGFENFGRAFTNQDIRGPFLRVLGWTFVFSILSVLLTFALGLFLAIVFNTKLRGRRFYRTFMILPYAFPATMMVLVWQGLFNQQFGFINQALVNPIVGIFGLENIDWLNSPTMAKVAVLIVNLWLGFPYQFLVCTGALQSLPEDIVEAADVDGATSWQIFKTIKLPLLMVSLAPLLISSFAFNFNNFNLIFLLTRGGPRFLDTSLNTGSTDILISMVYKIAFIDGSRDYGLGSAFAILIFIIVGITAGIGFRQTKALEDIN